MNALWTVALTGVLLSQACARSDPERVQHESAVAAPALVSGSASVGAGSSADPVQHAVDSAPLPASGVADCNRVCKAATKLHCKKSASCVSSCIGMVSSAADCSNELSSFFQCLGSQSSDHWECLEDGTGAIREGFCESEQAAFAACLDRNQR
jgi:hypothetical protein